jgi:hypothetical protein
MKMLFFSVNDTAVVSGVVGEKGGVIKCNIGSISSIENAVYAVLGHPVIFAGRYASG